MDLVREDSKMNMFSDGNNKVYSMIEEIFADCDVTLYEYNGG